MRDDRSTIARAEMLIRKPVEEVFEAFVNPEITSRFWFTKSSGRLEEGKRVRWDWGMYGVSGEIIVKALDENERILIEWPTEDAPAAVEWIFTPRTDGTTFVSITNTGVGGDKIVEEAIGATEGFTLVLAGLKALLEHDVSLNLVSDRFPDGLAE